MPTDFGGDAAAAAKARSRSVWEPNRAYVEAEVAKGCNAEVIFQGLVEHHGYDGAYDAVKRFVRKLVPADPKICCRFETPPSEVAEALRGALRGNARLPGDEKCVEFAQQFNWHTIANIVSQVYAEAIND